MSVPSPTVTGPISADAFRRVYPAEYLESFLAKDTRSDGRPLGRARALTCVVTPGGGGWGVHSRCSALTDSRSFSQADS